MPSIEAMLCGGVEGNRYFSNPAFWGAQKYISCHCEIVSPQTFILILDATVHARLIVQVVCPATKWYSGAGGARQRWRLRRLLHAHTAQKHEYNRRTRQRAEAPDRQHQAPRDSTWCHDLK